MNSEELLREETAGEDRAFSYCKKVQGYREDDDCLFLEFSGTEVAIKFVTPEIARITLGEGQGVDFATTPGIVDFEEDVTGLTVEDTGQEINLKSGPLTISVHKDPFELVFRDGEGKLLSRDLPGRALGKAGSAVRACKQIQDGERFYGLGEKTGFLDKRGKKYTMWNTDNFYPHVEDNHTLYQSIPLVIGLTGGLAYGLYFDNSYKTTFDLGHEREDRLVFQAEGGRLDYYFMLGPDLKKVVSRYTDLTGKPPLPPRWSLGYHQSRYSYYPEQEVREIAGEFRDRGLPCDCIHLDIDYMDDYRVFTWDQEGFPHPASLLSDLKEDGYKVVTIIDPGVKKDPEYHVYRQGCQQNKFCKYLDGQTYYGEVWPGTCAFPDFTREDVRDWWGQLHQPLLEAGIRGIWNDMNEPAVFNDSSTMDTEVIHDHDGDMGTHRRFHNLYGLFEAKATYSAIKEYKKERPFVLTRAGFAGIQRYAAVWTGDNRSYWDHLRLAMPMLMNLGLSGVSFAGTDIGGFTGDSNGELLTRWTQLGAVTPFFRNHSARGSKPQEPWSFGPEYEGIIRDYIQLRYRLLPYLYNLFYQASETGLPVMRPLVMEYPEDEKTHNLFDEFMLGDSMLVAPVYQPDKEMRTVYLPVGRWYDFWTNREYKGGQYHLIEAPLAKLPLFIREGSILPLTEPVNYIGEQDRQPLVFYVYPDRNGETEKLVFYEDDGISFAHEQGEYSLTEIELSTREGQPILRVEEKKTDYDSRFAQNIFKIMDQGLGQVNLLVNGGDMSRQHKRYILNE